MGNKICMGGDTVVKDQALRPKKFEIIKIEHLPAKYLKESEKNPIFGFECLYYSVSEFV